MKYFESNSDFSSKSVASPADLLRFVIACIFLSPIRLVLEVSKKVMFTGCYFKKFILNCIYLNSALIVLSVINSLFITKRFYLYGSLMPITSLVISFILLLAIYFMSPNFELDLDFDSTDSIEDEMSKIEEVYREDDKKEDVKQTIESDFIDDEIEIDLEINNDSDFNKVYEEEANKQLEKVPSDFLEEAKRRIELQKEKLRDNTNLHPTSSSIKNNFKDVMDQDKSKVDSIKSVNEEVDSGFDVNSIKDFVSTLRGFKSPSVPLVGEEDDFPSSEEPEDIEDYSKKILQKVNRKKATLDSLMVQNNSSVMMDEEPSSPSIKDTFNNYLNEDKIEENDFKDDLNLDALDSIYYGGGFGYEDEPHDPSFGY